MGYNKLMIYLLLGSNLLMAGSFILTFSKLPPQIPFFYSKPWGEDQLAELWMIALLPVIMNSFYFFNLFLIRKLFSDNKFIGKLIVYINVIFVVLLTFTFLNIIFLIS